MTNASHALRTHLSSAWIWLLVSLVFARSLVWLTKATLAQEQLLHAALVLLFGIFVIMRDRRPAFEFGRRAGIFLACAILAAGAATIFQQPLLMIFALGFLAGAVLLFVYGDSAFRPALGLGCAFAGLLCAIVFFPLADWPLRVMAGRTAMWFLDFVGDSSQLGFVGDPPKLILLSGSRPFEVASECNGFGIISGCVLLALLLAWSRRLKVVDKIIALILAPLLGLFSNALRIFLIVLLTPLAGDHYFLMHEIVGTLLFIGTLVFFWWLVSGLPERRKNITPRD